MTKDEWLIAGGLALLLIVYVSNGDPSAAGASIAKGAVNAAGGVINGTVQGIGSLVGIPNTNPAQCQTDINNGDTLASSFSCDASTWLKSLL